MDDEMIPGAKDIKIGDLVPLRERDIDLNKNKGFAKLLATIRAVGLLNPLSVYRENGKYNILDGFLRYKGCEQLGIDLVPCLVYPDKEAYTFNRMVNHLSPVQEMRMLRRSLKEISEKKIAEVFGHKSLRYRLGSSDLQQLHPLVIKTLDQNLMSRSCAEEFIYVQQTRQLQMLKEMAKNGDYSLSFARALVIKTPENLRNPEKKQRKPWTQNSASKKKLVAKLEGIEKRHDFYTNLYRQYTADLLKLAIFVRKLITNEEIRDYLEAKHPDLLARFKEIVLDMDGKKKRKKSA